MDTMTTWTHLCDHPETEVRRYTISNGTVTYRQQCLSCGRLVRGAIAKAKVPHPEAVLDVDLEAKERTSSEAYWEAWRQEQERKRQKQQEDFWGWYDEYLQSQAWAIRRRKVLERSKYLCEGCGTARAQQVHHLTYSHVGRELLFQLVALCQACHDEAHTPNGREQQP